MNQIGSRIKAARKRMGMSQKVLAQRICKCPSAISGYENNNQIPPGDVLIHIAKLLNVSTDYLLGLDSNESYSARNLTPQQRKIVDLLFAEFSSPSNTGTKLSAEQMQIIQELFELFSHRSG